MQEEQDKRAMGIKEVSARKFYKEQQIRESLNKKDETQMVEIKGEK